MTCIIHEGNLREDFIEGIAEVLSCSMQEVRQHVDEADVEYVIDKMFETESECIHAIAQRIKGNT